MNTDYFEQNPRFFENVSYYEVTWKYEIAVFIYISFIYSLKRSVSKKRGKERRVRGKQIIFSGVQNGK